MPVKKIQKNTQNPENACSVTRQADFSAELPQNVAYGAFLSVAIVVTSLLYGASFRMSHMSDSAVVTIDRHAALQQHIEKMVDGYPIERMSLSISKYDKTTAAFLVGIAKKESNWGKHVPVDEEGKDCYNYWGYRGAGSRGIAMGHGCFGSPEEAVTVVGKRVNTFVQDYKFDTPEELVVWKCGWKCLGQDPKSVKKWIADVGFYYRKVKD